MRTVLQGRVPPAEKCQSSDTGIAGPSSLRRRGTPTIAGRGKCQSLRHFSFQSQSGQTANRGRLARAACAAARSSGYNDSPPARLSPRQARPARLQGAARTAPRGWGPPRQACPIRKREQHLRISADRRIRICRSSGSRSVEWASRRGPNIGTNSGPAAKARRGSQP
jgi:hypothetical protein